MCSYCRTPFVTINIALFLIYSKDLLVDLSDAELKDATITALNTTGAVIVKQSLNSNQKNTVQLSVPTGIYFYAISSGTHFQQGKVVIR